MHRLEGPVFGPEDETWGWVEEGDRIGVVAGWECDDESVEVKFQVFDVEGRVDVWMHLFVLAWDVGSTLTTSYVVPFFPK